MVNFFMNKMSRILRNTVSYRCSYGKLTVFRSSALFGGTEHRSDIYTAVFLLKGSPNHLTINVTGKWHTCVKSDSLTGELKLFASDVAWLRIFVNRDSTLQITAENTYFSGVFGGGRCVIDLMQTTTQAYTQWSINELYVASFVVLDSGGIFIGDKFYSNYVQLCLKIFFIILFCAFAVTLFYLSCRTSALVIISHTSRVSRLTRCRHRDSFYGREFFRDFSISRAVPGEFVLLRDLPSQNEREKKNPRYEDRTDAPQATKGYVTVDAFDYSTTCQDVKLPELGVRLRELTATSLYAPSALRVSLSEDGDSLIIRNYDKYVPVLAGKWLTRCSCKTPKYFVMKDENNNQTWRSDQVQYYVCQFLYWNILCRIFWPPSVWCLFELQCKLTPL